MTLSRRSFLQVAGAGLLAAGCGRAPRAAVPEQRMIVLGVDGMDPTLLQRFLDEGRMPHCRRLIESGSFHRLATSNPPQSPVAWSNFISGTDPGGHGIFDFIARDPSTMQLFQATSRIESARRPLRLGDWVIPLGSNHIVNRRQGATFWENLEQAGVDCTIFRVPANFPPTESEATTLAGMGTPDLLGGYGTFTFFTDELKQKPRDVNGGRIERAKLVDDVASLTLKGPPNDLSASGEQATVVLSIFRDPQHAVAKITAHETEVVLGEREWSDWVRVRFSLGLGSSVSGICRMYLKSVREPFALYISPINIDPSDPSVPLSTPPDYSRQLVREVGYFYTQGIIEDTQAWSSGVLNADEFRQQALFVHDERLRFYEHELNRFRDGFLFYYFSTLDLGSHMFWRTIDREHPNYSADLAAAHGDFLAAVYSKVDDAVGRALERLDGRGSLIVLSDHGFSSFRRQFQLNSWLLDNGYLRTSGPPARDGSRYFQGVDWSRSRAYGVGLNGLYLNRKGRERDGRVPDSEAQNLLHELATRLTRIEDPDTGEHPISHVHITSEIYKGPYAASGPDLLVGYNRNYRASWDTILGGFPRQHLSDNTDAWSGDHCIDASHVPGVLLSSRPLKADAPRIEDVAPTILTSFGVPVPEQMTGRSII